MSLFKRHFELVFETLVMLFIYVVGAVFLAMYADPMALTAWITGGAVVAGLLRSFTGGNNNNRQPDPPSAPDPKPRDIPHGDS